MIEADQTAAAGAAADWEQTFDAVSDPMAILTPDYRVVRANAAYLAWMHTTRARCEGHECFALAGERESPCDSCPLPQTLAAARPSYVRHVRLQSDGADGTPAPHVYETWTYPVTGADGRVERVVEIIKDVTERERLQQVTSEARALREADNLKTELLGTVSHELRSPLATIKGYAATLLKYEKRLDAAERREFLEAIVEASDRLAGVIEQMLEFSQLEAANTPFQRGPVDLGRLAREAVRAAERDLEAHSPGTAASARFALTIETAEATGMSSGPDDHAADEPGNLGDSAIFVVLGDARRLRSVLDQLLANAVKYSPHGGTVAVTMRRYQPAHQEPTVADVRGGEQDRESDPGGVPRVEVLVQDTGIGIPSDQLSRVFDRFHRVDTSLTREADGLGLGLAIARRVVELHGGSIWAESVAGGGSTFHVVLPSAPAEPEESASRL
jgi:signal transduction histidine kinase